jgi:hypothetical protein
MGLMTASRRVAPVDDGPRLYDLEDAAERLRMSKHTLRKKVTRGEVPVTYPAGVKVAKFSDQDIADIIAAGRKVPTAEPVVIRRRKKTAA